MVSIRKVDGTDEENKQAKTVEFLKVNFKIIGEMDMVAIYFQVEATFSVFIKMDNKMDFVNISSEMASKIQVNMSMVKEMGCF